MKSEDIAKLAGVSRSTVSRVINNYPNIPEKTKQKVQAVIDKYGYTPNSIARTLAGKKNNIIGLFIFDKFYNKNIDPNNPMYSIHDSPYLSELISYVTDAAENNDFNILISVINSQSKKNKFDKLIKSDIISGAIIVGGETDKEILGKIISSKIKTVFIDEYLDGEYDNIIHIYSENYEGAYTATQELIKAGHKKIAHITGNLKKFDARERLRAFKDCLIDNGIKLNKNYIIEGDFSLKSGYNAAKELYEKNKNNMPTAIFIANDLMAVKAIEYFKEKNFNIPQDISIIGFDNHSFAEILLGGLSTISRPIGELAIKAVNSLITFIYLDDKSKIKQEKIKSNYINRKTIKPPK
ncbi:LacI family transcriptional regulator [Hypnocyclicus thermotrophus]|uniref:LacI family transcriptional regulator n=1 Tax=Hypnocyclicus thermotrophus TaxID=1627895 RepID=A0AA46I5Q2_9FUSO|nr:LacI family DNA-binding transcriptional regulator [Hypnocyclicus thermotrophus]TDT71428.1 LacI family transcriptional regulator [Hypnocyclicus thermotrophus]